MAFLDNVLLALESLKMNKMRAILTMLGIIIGIGSVVAINTVGTSLTDSVSSTMTTLGANNITVSLTQKSDDDNDQQSNQNNSNNQVKIKKFGNSEPSEEDRISDNMISEFRSSFSDKIEYLELTRSSGTATVQNYDDKDEQTSVTVKGVNDEYLDAEDINLLCGRFIKNKTDLSRRLCIVSDKFVEDALGIETKEAVGKSITITYNEMPYTFFITGVYEYEETIASSYLSSDETVTDFYIPLETARTLSGENKGYESFKIVAKGGTDTAAFLDTVGEYFEAVYSRNDEWTCKATSLESMISTFTDMMDTVSLAIAAIAAISLLVGGIGVMNIMLVSITERTKEIGTRKALGAPNNSIRLQFITESVVICLIGGIIGVAIGLAGGMTISYLLGFYALPSISSIIIALVFSMFIGIVFGYAPANKAAKLNPIDALRYE